MQKLKSLKFLESLSKKLKKNKRKIVLCHGDFDFLHLGHIKHFKAAKEKADYLIVSVTSDSKMQKGIGRPLYKEKERIEFLSSLSIIDFLYVDHNKTAIEVISKIKPEMVFTTPNHDLNKDHQIVFESTVIATRSITSNVKDILSYELPGIVKTPFLPNRYVEISKEIKHKINAFKMYKRTTLDGLKPYLSKHFNLTVELPLKAITRGYSFAVVPNSWENRSKGTSKLIIKEMGSRYLFIIFYCLIEKWLCADDYRK